MKRKLTILATAMFVLLTLSVLITPLRAHTATNTTVQKRSQSNMDSLSYQIDVILRSGKLVFLYFYKENCYACRLQKPLIEELEQEYSNGVGFIRVNGLKNRKAMVEFGVRGFPTMFLISGRNTEGYEYKDFMGYTEKSMLKINIDNLISPVAESVDTLESTELLRMRADSSIEMASETSVMKTEPEKIVPTKVPYGKDDEGGSITVGGMAFDMKPELIASPNARVPVLFSFPGPGYAATGLTWDGTNLWLADWYKLGEPDIIYQIDPSDGSVIRSFKAPCSYPSGLAWDGRYLWVSCEQTATAYKLYPKDGSVISSIRLPGYGEGDPNSACITWDGKYLWHTDYTHDTIYRLDPSNGKIVHSFASPGPGPSGLAWDGTYLWHSDSSTDTIYKLSPKDGSVLLSFASPASHPWDLTWDGSHLWNADWPVNTVFKIARFALFKDSNPWGYTEIEDLLSAYGIHYDVHTSGAMGGIDLSPYEKVITASIQGNNFWNALEANKAWFENYANDGGILEMHLCAMPGSNSPGKIYPGGFNFSYTGTNEISIVDSTHPVLNTPNTITDDELDNWSSSAHGWFSTLPVGGREVLEATINGKPVFADLKFGSGAIFATTQTVEWRAGHGYPEFLENMILYMGRPPSKDVLIIDHVNKRAFFGWYRTSQMPSTGWDLLQRTIDWADGFMKPSETDIVLFTYDGTTNPPDANVTYTYLTNKGYDNITVRFQGDAAWLPVSYYADFDLVLYWTGYGYDSTNIVNSGIPFITVSTMQTDEMGIGTGTKTMHEVRDTFYVENNAYYPTKTYPLGLLTFESSMWTDATEAAGNGIALVTVPAAGACYDYTISMWIDPPTTGDWNVDHVIECNDAVITLNGDLLISEELRLNHVKLMMNTPNMEDPGNVYNIQVDSGGAFYINSKDGLPSVITNGQNASAYYTFQVNSGSEFMMSDSELHYCGYAWNKPNLDLAGLWISTDNVTIENSLLDKNFVGIVFFNSGDHTIINNKINSNDWYGIYGYNSPNNVIEQNEIKLNGKHVLAVAGGGISLSGASDSVITDNTIIDNSRGSGISLSGATNSRITDNVVNSHAGHTGIALSSSSGSNITNNHAEGNGHTGIALSSSSGSDVINNYAEGNGWCGISISSSPNTEITGNTANSNNHGICVSSSKNTTIEDNTANSNDKTNRYSTGISVTSSDESKINNNSVEGNWQGIVLGKSSDTTIENNTVISNMLFGIYLYSDGQLCIHNKLIDNYVYNSTKEFDSAGIYLSESGDNEITINRVNNNNLGIILWKSSNVNITNNNANLNTVGVSVRSSHSTRILHNTASGCGTGISLSSSNSALIFNNTASGCGTGIYLHSSHFNTVERNIALENNYGISLSHARSNDIFSNTARYNYFGISLRWSSNSNNVTNNDAKWCGYYGAYIFSSDDNTVETNDFSYSGSVGISLEQSDGNRIYRNDATYAENYGIVLFESDWNQLHSNNVIGSKDIGIELSSSNHNDLIDNTAEECDVGISIRFSTYNLVDNNIIVHNGIGLYLLRSDSNTISYNIIVMSSNVGIDLSVSHDNEILHNTVNENLNYGIHLYSSDRNYIFSNEAIMNGVGIYLDWSSNNTIEENLVTNNTCVGIAIYWSSDYNQILLNQVQSNMNISIRVSSSSFNLIQSNIATYSAVGIFLDWAQKNEIVNNTADFNAYHGITLDWFSDNNHVTNNSVTHCGLVGISLGLSGNNIISYNNVTFNDFGIVLEWSSNNNTIMFNTMAYNTNDGLSFHWESNYNLIKNNTIGHNSDYGVYVNESSNNTIYHNDIVYNKIPQAFDLTPADNNWHHPGLLEGNYWSDYPGADDGSGTGKHAIAGDGIGDTDIPWPDTDYDFYPLMSGMAVLTRDVAILNVTVSKNVVGQGYSISINVTVQNQGEQTETFNVTAYANTTEIDKAEITLTSGSSTTITFTWDTTSWTMGNYTIKAEADTVPDEIDTADNTFIDGWVVVTIPGDINGDYKVDHMDLLLLASVYGSEDGDPNYIPEADINGDGKVDHKDLLILAANYGKHL